MAIELNKLNSNVAKIHSKNVIETPENNSNDFIEFGEVCQYDFKTMLKNVLSDSPSESEKMTELTGEILTELKKSPENKYLTSADVENYLKSQLV